MPTNRNKERIEWPTDAAMVYRNIEDLTGEVDRLLTRIWIEGLGEERNLYLLRDLLPIVRKLAGAIQNECDRYWVLKKNQAWPHWPGWAVRDIEPLAGALVQASLLAERAMSVQPPNLNRARQMVKEALDYPAMIKTQLYQGPPPGKDESVPAEWRVGLDDVDLSLG